MSHTALLLAAAVGVPLAMLVGCGVRGLRPLLARLLWLAPLPALAAALFGAMFEPLVVGAGPAALVFALDGPGAVLLGAAAVLWSLAGAYAQTYMPQRLRSGGVLAAWLMTLTGCVGVFLAADLIGFYGWLAVLSVGASGLVLLGEGPGTLRAAGTYLGLALVAEAFLLAGLVLLALASPNGSLLIADVVAALPDSPWRDLTLALLLVGLGMKAGLLPMHFWMPLAYPAATIPAAAVLSGAVVKASVLALIRFLPFEVALPALGLPLAVLGLAGALYGVAIGVTQTNPKVVLAYSSVSQMGFLVAVIGMGLAAADTGTPLAATFYAAHHLLVKGALFLAVGVVAVSGAARWSVIVIPVAFIALGLGGLPLTGGALAKDATKALLGDGLAGSVATLSSIASSMLMLHFVLLLRAGATAAGGKTPPGLLLPWLAMALASVALPWLLYFALGIGTLATAFAPSALLTALWPVALGVALAFVLERVGLRLPRIPPGDVGNALPLVTRAGAAIAVLFVHIDAFSRRWTVATLAMLALALAFGAFLASVGVP